MKHIPLDIHEDMPPGMKRYINNYGWHFNKRAYEYAVKLMFKRNIKTNKDEPIECYTKEEVDALLKECNVEIQNKVMYDYVYVYAMCIADYPKAIPNKEAKAYFIKETVDDIDASDETTFRRWVATMVGNGIPIDWYEIC